MNASSNYPDLIEAGLRKPKKKKKMERGENSMYDPERARRAEDQAELTHTQELEKRMGIKWGGKKKRS